ncbi:MAG: hypothetical protein HC767_06045 [Akkermansiaceae bacterium]|nr:hypothetical protein [Akkermansiaceae bacterium]
MDSKQQAEDMCAPISTWKSHSQNLCLSCFEKFKQPCACSERISTGCLTLDSVLGGGIARGRVVEIFGPESCGKTSLAVCIMAEAQKQFPNDNVVLMDLESSFDINYGMRLGLQKKNCYIGAPNSGDQALKVCIDCHSCPVM